MQHILGMSRSISIIYVWDHSILPFTKISSICVVWRCNRQLNGWSIPFSRFIVFQSWGYTLFLPYYKENETQETMSPHCLETLYINIWIAFTYREALNHALIHIHINRDTHWLKHKHGQNEKLQLFNNKYLKYIK